MHTHGWIAGCWLVCQWLSQYTGFGGRGGAGRGAGVGVGLREGQGIGVWWEQQGVGNLCEKYVHI